VARSALTVQQQNRTGTVPTYAAANVDGNSFTNDAKTWVHAKNGSGGSITLTFVSPGTEDGLAIADHTVAIAAGAEKVICDLGEGTFEQTSGADRGSVYLDYSGVTSLTIGVFRLA
jgi:hypothetical protein